MEQLDQENYIDDLYKLIDGDTIYWVYEGVCNGTRTKWVTTSEWDCASITVKRQGDELIYFDKHKKEMFVYEEDEDGWNIYSH